MSAENTLEQLAADMRPSCLMFLLTPTGALPLDAIVPPEKDYTLIRLSHSRSRLEI